MRKYIVIFLILVLMFNGLKNIRELTELGIVKTIGIDMDQDGALVFNAIVAQTSDKEDQNKGEIYSSKGPSVQEAARNMVDVSPKKLYIGHLNALVLSEEIARENLENILDFFIRDNEGSNSFYFIIARDCKAEDVLKVINEQEVEINTFLKSNQKYKGNANLDNLNDNIKDIMEKGTELCVNSIKIDEDSIIISDMAYFNKWDMMGYLTDEESTLYNMLMNKTENFLVSVGEDDDLIVSEVFDSKTNMSINKKDKNTVDIDVKIKSNVTQVGRNIELNNEEVIKEIENKLKDKIKKDLEDFCTKIKDEYKSDILHIGNLLYRKKNKLFEDPEYLNKVNLNINVDLEILSQGGVKKVW